MRNSQPICWELEDTALRAACHRHRCPDNQRTRSQNAGQQQSVRPSEEGDWRAGASSHSLLGARQRVCRPATATAAPRDGGLPPSAAVVRRWPGCCVSHGCGPHGQCWWGLVSEHVAGAVADRHALQPAPRSPAAQLGLPLGMCVCCIHASSQTSSTRRCLAWLPLPPLMVAMEATLTRCPR